jgi:hypothetical protein
MPRLTIAEELESAIRVAAKEAGNFPSRQIAVELYRSDRKLMEAFAEEWGIEKLTGLIRFRRSKDRREENPQLFLLGFKPPPKVNLKNGKQTDWGNAATPVAGVVAFFCSAEPPAWRFQGGR